jgi:hypothetical protein
MKIRSCAENRILRLSIELRPVYIGMPCAFPVHSNQPQEIVIFSGMLHSVEGSLIFELLDPSR